MICNKCNNEYPDTQPYCARPQCVLFTTYKQEFPPEGGKLTYMLGMKYPWKGYSDHIVLGQNATVKRALMASVRLLSNIFKSNLFDNVLRWISDIYEAEYEKYQYPEKELCKSSREILRTGKKFCDPNKPHHEKALWCIVMFWELDSAYRLRGQDILSEINKENLKKNVYKEVNRLIRLGVSREKAGLESKWNNFSKILRIIFFSKKFRETVKNILLELNIEEIKPDTGDLYWMARYFDYDFAGLPYAMRAAWKEEEDKTYIPPILHPKDYVSIDLRPNKFFYELDKEHIDLFLEKIKSRLIEDWKSHEQIRVGNTIN